jgi:hypothetical protein
MAVTTENSAAAGVVRPFKAAFPQADIDELRRRLQATRWPEKETVGDESQGVQLATMEELVRYWGMEYDFGRLEVRINAFPHFLTEIDGLDIHFIHVRSPHENALPMIITHPAQASTAPKAVCVEPPQRLRGTRLRGRLREAPAWSSAS